MSETVVESPPAEVPSTALQASRPGWGRELVKSKDTLRSMLAEAAPSLREILPKHLTAQRVLKMAIIAASRQPALLECTQVSFLQAVMRAAELGLDFTGTLGSGYLVPFHNKRLGVREVQFIPGYRGLIDLARRSGQIANIEAHVVYESDALELEYGTNPRLKHRPSLKDDPGPLKCVYAIGTLKDGCKQVEVMTRAQVESIRRRSKAANDGPWVTDYDEMARKTAVRRVCKYLPLSPEVVEALAAEDEIHRNAEYANDIFPPPEQEPQGTRGDQLADKLEKELRPHTHSSPPAHGVEPAPVPDALPSPEDSPTINRDEYIMKLTEALPFVTAAQQGALRVRFKMAGLTDGESLRNLSEINLVALMRAAEKHARDAQKTAKTKEGGT